MVCLVGTVVYTGNNPIVWLLKIKIRPIRAIGLIKQTKERNDFLSLGDALFAQGAEGAEAERQDHERAGHDSRGFRNGSRSEIGCVG